MMHPDAFKMFALFEGWHANFVIFTSIVIYNIGQNLCARLISVIDQLIAQLGKKS